MKKLLTKMTIPIKNEKGQGMVEYGLIIALVAVVVIGALVLLGGNITNIFNNVASAISK
jgi:pilus assembly protein Flp/PilA